MMVSMTRVIIQSSIVAKKGALISICYGSFLARYEIKKKKKKSENFLVIGRRTYSFSR